MRLEFRKDKHDEHESLHFRGYLDIKHKHETRENGRGTSSGLFISKIKKGKLTKDKKDTHGVPPTKRLFLVTESLSLTRSPHLLVLGECLEVWDYHGWYVPSKIMLKSMTIHLEVRPIFLRKLDGTVWKYLGYGKWSRPTGF